MNLCSDGHYEVCYEVRSCPVCDEMAAHADTKTDLRAEEEAHEKEISKLEDRINTLQNFIDSFIEIKGEPNFPEGSVL